MIANAIYQFFNIIIFLMVVRILLTWFPNVNWYKEPFCSLRKFTDLFLEPFRKIIPPIGMIDISPIVAFLVIGAIQKLLVLLAAGIGI